MKWNWQHEEWPNFSYESSKLSELEASFLRQSGVVIGVLKHVSTDQYDELIIDLISTEAIKTSEIEGEYLVVLQSLVQDKLILSVDTVIQRAQQIV